jgi:amino acid adenylation domain-containing protein
LVHQYIPHSSAYHIALAIHLIGNLDCSSLEQSLNVLIQRHDCLRTSISVVDGNPVQVIQAIAPMHLPILEHPSSPDCQSLSNSWLEDAQTPFDLSQAPLWRTKLLRLTATHAILLLTLHHIIADGWSIGVLLQELKELYQAFSTGRSPVLPPLAIQYAAFSEWQRQWLQGEILDTQLGYWQQQLSGDPPLLNLPIDFPRPAVRSFRGKRQTLILPRSLTERIKHLSQQEGTTLFMTLLTAFKTLLYRYTEQADLWVGVPIANRHQTEVEQLIGCFVNTLILRTDLSGNPTVREVLRRVRRVALDAYTHQDLPFERLVEALQPQRDLSHTPLFQVMFVFQNVPGLILQDESTVGHLPSAQPDCCASEINWQVEEIDTESAKFDLTLFMADRGAELSATLEYNTDLFNANTITRMLGHLQILLEDIAANPDLPISNLSLLTPLERDRLLIDWQQQPCSLPYSTLHQWFEAQVEQTPDAIAVVYQDESLTYRDLNQRANQLAHYLRSIGVKPEVLVGICTERSPAMVVGLFGILKAGGAYVPLDPTYPQERLMFMLRDSQSPVLVTQQRLINTIPSAILDIPQLTLVCLDSDWQMIAHEPSDNPDHTTTADHLAYVIYTSGSTGKPKGAMIQHRGLVNYLNWCIQAYPVQQGTGAPIHSSISFDMTITGLFSPLLVGRAVELLPDGFGVDALSQVLRHKPNFSLVKITPAQLELLSHQVSSQDTTIGTQAFIIGGENLSAQSLAFWQRLSPNTLLVNEYGPTETVVGCCVYPVPHSLPPSGWVPIGRAIANTQLYILDSHLQLVPVGVTGELYIGGMGVARGYLHRPDLTAERFIPNPYSPQTGTRLYKTGDRARYLPDGTIECLGRTDNQVKIRGFRIELGEIEAALNQHPAIQESLVVTREVAAADWRLIAYVVPQSAEATPNLVPLLRDWLKQHLPDYMVPANVVILDAFPLTVNGKIDRQALPVPATIRPELSVAYTSPQTELERSIAHLWQSALGVDTVGIHDNFFDLGGHSLLLVQIHHHLQTLLQQPLSVIELFKYPTIHAIAKHLSQTADPSAQFQQVQDRVKQQKAAISRQQQLMQGGRKTHG